jgi:hypothetical protein
MPLSQAVISAGIAEIYDCMDAGVRITQGTVVEEQISALAVIRQY